MAGQQNELGLEKADSFSKRLCGALSKKNERHSMGKMADAMVAYAQPMLDETDGSEEQINKVFSIAHVCWNLALLPENEREEGIAKIRKSFEEADDAEFADFRQSIIEPMIRRHHEMFPDMPRFDSQETPQRPPQKKYHGTGRNAPCPCGSGKKYKKCCGK